MNINKTLVKHSKEEGVGFLFLLLRYLGIRLKGAFALTVCIVIGLLFNSESDLSQKLKLNLQDLVYSTYRTLSGITYNAKHLPQYLSPILSYYLPSSTSYYDLEELEQENTYLKERIKKLEIDISENQSLRELLNYHEETKYKEFITARIISKNTSKDNSLFVINAGHNQGIEVGDTVLSKDALAGKVIETTANSAAVLSITDSSSKISGLVLPSRSKCLVFGTGEFQRLGTFFPSEVENTEPNNLIITSGDGGIFPYGIPIANLQIKDNTSTAIPIFDFINLEFVQIIKNDKFKNYVGE